jgi:hypothetical protein
VSGLVYLTPAEGAPFEGPLTDPWPSNLEGSGHPLGFLETDGADVAIYTYADGSQQTVYRQAGIYRMDVQNG